MQSSGILGGWRHASKVVLPLFLRKVHIQYSRRHLADNNHKYFVPAVEE